MLMQVGVSIHEYYRTDIVPHVTGWPHYVYAVEMGIKVLELVEKLHELGFLHNNFNWGSVALKSQKPSTWYSQEVRIPESYIAAA